MKKPNLVLDVDGVLLNWIKGFDEWVGRNFPNIKINPALPFRNGRYQGHFENELGRFELSSNHRILNYLANRFCQSFAASMLRPMDYAYDVLSGLKKDFDLNISYITAFGTGKDYIFGRNANILREFGDLISHASYVNHGDSKKKYLKNYDPTRTVYIDDEIMNVRDSLDCEIETLFMNNRVGISSEIPEGVPTVKNWLEIDAWFRNPSSGEQK